MSRAITAITPKNLANKTIEDLIDNLTLQSLDLTNGLLILTGATVIGASALIPDPLQVNTINERTAGNLTIAKTEEVNIISDIS